MRTTTAGDAWSPVDVSGVKLRLDVYDRLAAKHGAHTVSEQAALHGVHRSYMYRLRAGDRGVGLDLAMQMAADLGTTVEDLFERTVRVA